MAAQSAQVVVLEIADRLLRAWFTVVAGISLGLAGGIVALHYMPRTYEASTTIFVAPQQIPQEFVRSTVTDDMSIRLASLREAVLSRPYLTKLVEKFAEETHDSRRDAEAIERTIQSMRSRIEVNVIESERVGSRSGGVFTLTYRDNDPERAAQLVNTLADFYMEENARFRAGQAEGTTRTISGLAEGVLAQLQTKEREVADFKSKHLYETQAHFDANVQLLQGRQQDLTNAERDLGLARDRLQSLKSLETQPGSAGAEVNGAAADPVAARIAQVRREYETLRARYRDEHPDVKAKKRELDELLAGDTRSPAPDGSHGAAGGGAVPITPAQQRILAADREVARLEAERTRLRGEIEEYKRRIEATPRVEQQLTELSKGLDVLRDRYKDYQNKTEDAKGSQKIESIQKGERFEVIERAVPPALPIRPVPLLILAAGVLGGLALFVGPVVLRSILLPVVASEAGLRQVADVPLLVAIPRLETRGAIRAVRVRHLLNIVASAMSLAALAVVVSFLGKGW
jgi:succinoglycan biosynthesis transport protein ExoP